VLNEKLARGYFRGYRLAPEFEGPPSKERINGDIGLDGDVDEATHVVRVTGLHDMSRAVKHDGDMEAAVEITVAEIKAMPEVTMLTELKCIEGWSIFVQWKGARLADLIAKLGPATRSGNPPDVVNRAGDLLEYVALSTPDDSYYVGLDIGAALHPQTLLCYEMNGAPLTSDHGAPLRLVIPVKYGVKNIKRIGSISFTSKRPKDYWAELGYDWYAGL
jgi:DMSO/TMAO reductase YedYZ molybdopterin-dependent catalytic subunit